MMRTSLLCEVGRPAIAGPARCVDVLLPTATTRQAADLGKFLVMGRSLHEIET
jgi:hypothetical protein